MVAAALACAALLGLAAARIGLERFRRVRLQTAADATALAAATAYARGLNVAAASNQALMAAALADAALKVAGGGIAAKIGGKVARAAGGAPTSLTDAVRRFQDAWTGLGGPEVAGARPGGLAPAMMASVALATAAANGAAAVPIWNGVPVPGGLLPDLNLRRAEPADLLRILAGRAPQRREEQRYSYRPGGRGPRIEVPADRVEKVTYRDARGRIVERYRIASGPGRKAGKFLRVDRVPGEVLRLLDVPFPLLERDGVHAVLIAATPAGATARPAFAAAEATGGQVFDESFGTPEFDARLIPAPAWTDVAPEIARLAASPEAAGRWVMHAVASALSGQIAGRLGRITGGRSPI
jgi:hypothetical protein